MSNWPFGLRERSGSVNSQACDVASSTNSLQGFDEFMNLVIDDAVEVKQATKTTEESRRSLGKLKWLFAIFQLLIFVQVKYF